MSDGAPVDPAIHDTGPVYTLIAGLGMLALLTILPGPDVAVVTRVALTGGRLAAFGAALGISTGCLVWGLLTAAGVATVLTAAPTALLVVKVLGAGYLIWLGVRSWQQGSAVPRALPAATAPAANAPANAAGPPSGPGLGSAWRTGLAVNLLNPKIGIFYTSLLPQLVPPGWPVGPTIVGLVLAHDAMGMLWLNGYALVLDRAGAVLRRPGVGRWLDRVTGTALIGFGLKVLAEARR